MDARGIHHLGVAVEDLDEAVATYERLFGAEVEHRATVTEQGVEAAALPGGRGRCWWGAAAWSCSRRSAPRRRSASPSRAAGPECTTSRTRLRTSVPRSPISRPAARS